MSNDVGRTETIPPLPATSDSVWIVICYQGAWKNKICTNFSCPICICNTAAPSQHKITFRSRRTKVHFTAKLIGSLMRPSGGLTHFRDRQRYRKPFVSQFGEVLKWLNALSSSPSPPSDRNRNQHGVGWEWWSLLCWRPCRLYKCRCSLSKPEYWCTQTASSSLNNLHINEV